jgi:hypothetical protein
MAQAPPPESESVKRGAVENDIASSMEATPMQRFMGLAERLLRVSRQEIAEQEKVRLRSQE